MGKQANGCIIYIYSLEVWFVKLENVGTSLFVVIIFVVTVIVCLAYAKTLLENYVVFFPHVFLSLFLYFVFFKT